MNFDEEKSAKAMEGHGTVKHCVEQFNRTSEQAQAWVHTLVTDNDASTRANVKWNLKEYYDMTLGKENWRKEDIPEWPKTASGNCKAKDSGMMPLEVMEVKEFLCDISHRVKSIGSSMYELLKTKAPPIPSSNDSMPEEDDTREKKMGSAHPAEKSKTKTNTSKTNNALETKTKARKKTQEEKDNTMLQYDCDKIKHNAFTSISTTTYLLKNSREGPTASICISLLTILCVT